MKRILLHTLAASAVLMGVGSADAACSFQASPMDFGQVQGPSGANATATFQASCSFGVPFQTIPLAVGIGDAARMLAEEGGAGQVRYELYRDAARTQVWTDPVLVGDIQLNALGSAVRTIVIYGSILPGQGDLKPASYSSSAPIEIRYGSPGTTVTVDLGVDARGEEPETVACHVPEGGSRFVFRYRGGRLPC